MPRPSVVSGKGNKAAFKSLKSFPVSVRRGVQKAFVSERPEMIRDTSMGMKKPKQGNWYIKFVTTSGRRVKNGIRHRASTKKQTPAVWSGDLRRSLGFRLKNGKTLTYGANTPYAKMHELSGRSYLFTTIRDRQGILKQKLSSEILKQIEGKK